MQSTSATPARAHARRAEPQAQSYRVKVAGMAKDVDREWQPQLPALIGNPAILGHRLA
jgi:hypothetical protein